MRGLFFSLIVFSFCSAMATGSSQEIQAKLDSLLNDKLRLQKSIAEYEAKMTELRQSVEATQKGLDEKSGVWIFESEEESRLKNQLHTARNLYTFEQTKGAGARLRVAQGMLADVDKEIDVLLATVSKDEAKKDETMRALMQKIKSQGLAIDFAALGTKLKGTDEALDYIEGVYDKTLVGAYLQDKIGQLLNSQVICAANNRCSVAGAQDILPTVIQKELFPNSRKARSEYYEKVNSKPASRGAK